MNLSEYDQETYDRLKDYLHTIKRIEAEDVLVVQKCDVFLKCWKWIVAFHFVTSCVFIYLFTLAEDKGSLLWMVFTGLFAIYNMYLASKNTSDVPKLRALAESLRPSIEHARSQIAQTEMKIKESMENNI